MNADVFGTPFILGEGSISTQMKIFKKFNFSWQRLHLLRKPVILIGFSIMCIKSIIHIPITWKTDVTFAGQKPFKCHLCARQFSRSDHLSLHMKRHWKCSQFSSKWKNCLNPVQYDDQCKFQFWIYSQLCQLYRNP